MQVVITQTPTVPSSKDGASPKTSNDHDAKSSVPRGHRSLKESDPVLSSEMTVLKADIASIESWWKEPRWEHTKRNYSGTTHFSPP